MVKQEKLSKRVGLSEIKELMKNKYTKITAKDRKVYVTDRQVYLICQKVYKQYKEAFDILKDK